MLADGPPLVGLMLILIGAVVLVAIALVIVVVGAGLAALVALAVVSLISIGILSSSVLVAFRSGSATKGVRLALLQVCVALGAVAGLGLAAVVKLCCHISLGWTPVVAIGLAGGIGIGAVIGASFSTLLKLVAQKFELEKAGAFEVVPQPAAILPIL